ncbi:MAG: ATP synthase subunit C [Candidatus Hydrothermarchaeaceae archaeon]
MVSKEDMLKGFVIVNAFLIIGLAFLMYGAVAAEEADDEGMDESVGIMSLGYGVSKAGTAIAAGLAVGIAALGAGLGVGIIGSAALGAIAEKKEMGSWSFIFIALAEGVAFYGLIISFMLIGKL